MLDSQLLHLQTIRYDIIFTPMHLAPQLLLRAERFPPLTLGLLTLRGRGSFGAEAIAARAADVPAFAGLLGHSCLLMKAKAGHIRRFGNMPALKFYLCGAKQIVV
jgi:hypothetical protein